MPRWAESLQTTHRAARGPPRCCGLPGQPEHCHLPHRPGIRRSNPFRAHPRRAAIAVAAVHTAVTLVACSSSDGARNAVAVGGTFQFHSPGGQAEIIYAEEERAPLPDFSGPSLMEEGEEISLLSDFEGEVVVLNTWGPVVCTVSGGSR